ncbi:MAG TPA: DMSO/selenate family reductase complex A subunit [Bryobacteraceae bacterium]|nr:DMSO/selenate family reductase complex A subunit [Bryobacteraceae bacterium]
MKESRNSEIFGLSLDRRLFLQLSGAGGAGIALAAIPARLPTGTIGAGESTLSIACNHNCGGRCVLKAHVKDGVITRITTDDSPDTAGRPQLRACLKGRALRNRLHDPARLRYPMKRTGKRGEGKFERISWDAAVEAIAANLKRIVASHGPASVYVQYATGDCGAINGHAAAQRLMNLMGGYLGRYNSYSSACLSYTAPFITGYRDNNSYQTLAHSKLIILNGFNPAETIFETNSSYYLARAKDAGARVVVIDPRLTETAATFADEWLPLKPTTDAALFVATAQVLIAEKLFARDFLDRYTIGFDEEHMPAGVPPGQSFQSYVIGAADGIPKTPEWAAPITGIDAQTIRNLARQYALLKPAQLLQGLGPQRHAHGEESVRAGIALACMTGNLGVLGGGWGGGEGECRLGVPIGSLPTGTNPVKTRIPVFLWTDAIVRGTEMTADDGVKGGPLPSNIKFIFNLAGNTLVNQHADVNRTVRILQDERLVECIVVSDHFMTPSARFADILLPADNSLERSDIGFPWSGERYIVFGNKVVEPPFECKHDYWWLSRVAERLGIGEAFTEGRTAEDWVKYLVNEARQRGPEFPTYEELSRQGFYRKDPEEYVAFAKEVQDPAHNPFPTPSGKIEIFSKTLYDMHKPGIPGVPHYVPAWEGPDDELAYKYPLQCIGPHYKRRTHSTWDENPWMEEADPQQMWISPPDAALRGVANGDRVKVFNDRGALLIRARVTKRIRPGVVAIPQGAWYTPDKDGVCRRGCINVLTSQKPTPLAHGNAQHTILVQVRKA